MFSLYDSGLLQSYKFIRIRFALYIKSEFTEFSYYEGTLQIDYYDNTFARIPV